MAATSPSAVLYAAKSTEDVHGSIPTQLADCRAMAERDGFEVVQEYQDEAASAYKGNRGPGLEAALQHVEEIKGVLIVQHSDRLARGDAERARHLIEIYLQALKAGFKLRSVQDDSTFDNLVMAAMMGERNTEDSRRKSLAVQAGKRRAWERGDFPGGPTPDGFERIDKDTVRPDPDRMAIIRQAGELADQGWGEPSIARELNARGHRTKGGQAWYRRRIQDTLSNPLYYGGVAWRRGKPDEEINWDTSYPALWSREDFERRARGRGARDLASGSNRRPKGAPTRNHALAGLATCEKCRAVMRPRTSTYRRKDGTRRRTYECRHAVDGTGLCDAPPVNAEAVDTHVINELHRYLGNFEAWRDQIASGHASERQRLEREVASARDDLGDQERICERLDSRIGLADTDDEAKAAMRAAATADQELKRRQRRFEASQEALSRVPDDVPADAMLDFYNSLSEAVRGRLSGATTIGRVNDALKDVFHSFLITRAGDGVYVLPVVEVDGELLADWVDDDPAVYRDPRDYRIDGKASINPPLRTFHAPSAELANSQEFANNAQVLPPMVVRA